jgi:methionyl-tRNA synthetase
VARYNADLANNLGNLVQRVTTVVHSKCGGVGPACDSESELAGVAAGVFEAAATAWARWAPHDALEETWRLIGAANARLEAAEPWKMDPGREVEAVMGDALEVLRIVAVLVAPAMPSTAMEVWRRIGVAGDPSAARLPDAASWGGYEGGVAVVKGEPLFPRRKG